MVVSIRKYRFNTYYYLYIAFLACIYLNRSVNVGNRILKNEA